MNWQEFEDRLGAEAQDHQRPVDTDALWEKIREKKRRRWLPFFWLAGGVMLIGSGLLLIAHYKGWTAWPEGADTPIQQDTAIARSPSGVFKANADQAVHTPTTTDQSILTSEQFENTNQSSVRSANWLKSASSIHPSSLPIWQADNLDAENAVTPVIKQLTNEFSNVDSLLKNILLTDLKKDHPSNDVPRLNNPLSAGLLILGSTQPQALPGLFNPFIALIIPLPTTAKLVTINPPLLPAKKSNPVYFGVQAGYYLWQIKQHLAGNNNAYPHNGETILAAVQTGLQAQIPLGSDWSVRTSLQYTQYRSVFRWSKVWTVVDTLTPVLNYYVNGNIDTTFRKRIRQYQRTVQHYNALHSIAMPLDLQYRIAIGKYSLKPSAGLQVQVWQRGNGVVLNDLEPDPTFYRSIYRRTFNLGLRFGLSLEAPLGPKARLFLEPAGLLDLISRTQKEYPAERFQQWGINIGVLRKW